MSSTPSSSRSRKKKPPTYDTSNDSPFRTAERYWKSRATNPDLRRALSVEAIEWEESDQSGRRKGVWRGDEGNELECWMVRVGELQEMGQKRWKGKAKAVEGDIEEQDYAVIIPAIPGLVLLPSLLPPSLQRCLAIESLRHSVLPNLTSLSAHYSLPAGGLWHAWETGLGDEVVPLLEVQPKGAPRRTRIDFEPVTKENWMTQDKERERERVEAEGKKEVTVKELLSRLRWTTIGWSYNWTSKTYDFDRPKTPLPPLTYRCCRDVIRAIPWNSVFGPDSVSTQSEEATTSEATESEDWKRWSNEYEPEAGVFNFYQLKDSLTAHIDQSEVDAVRPLVSFSIGHSAIFLVGGPTRDTPPLAIRLDSGDGLIMSGHKGRRVFHGLPRVIADSLPLYLAPEHQEQGEEDWRLFGEYLQAGARININVREVGI
ncbi:hypothetical protein BCR35DRAFT_268467 [Leucosporidium creatinivorum]|uniref:Alpha-ketoglutarate-dependent dioxygenase AlkB-like domain-containing protein n=1 Tax=Leucosporidium creatinivorum TaxID=106004 RepID=A0A1Y2ERX0_9BASI|nr:hypothetical protein BCR35DRAFT_268467 [Leucosporidium creatinivorum]